MTKSKKYQGVYFRKRKDGDLTYYFTYQNEMRKTKSQKVGLKSQGIDELYVYELRMKTILSLKNGELPPKLLRNNKKYKITVDEIADFYFNSHITTSSDKRRRQYNYRLKDAFGEMSIYNITEKHIEAFKNDTLGEVSEQTTIIYLELLGTLFNYYAKHKKIKLENPVLFAKKPRIDNVRERFLSKDEIQMVYDEVGDNLTMRLFLSLSLVTAGRKSTILNYTIKDVDLAHKMINSYDFKNKSTYKSFLDEHSIELIKIRISEATSPNDKLIYRDGIIDLDRWISRGFKIIFDNLFNIGLSYSDRKNRVVIHSLRHTCLSTLGMKGCNEFLIKKISNHKSSSMVNRYVKLSDDTGRNEIETLWK
ncbi:MAG: tyrosine-type recombinase/integrase [Thiovulaceae bacterium]|nr:tyrosine-type recombinase/integrase [Sulfurimonadaceae bacterium]